MSYEIGNRALANQSLSEGRSRSGQGKGAENQTHRGKVLSVETNSYTVGVLDESGRVLRIYSGVLAPSGTTFSVDDRVSLKVYEQSEEAVILSGSGGGGGGCSVSINAFGVYTG